MTTYESTLITYLPFSSNFFLLFFFFSWCVMSGWDSISQLFCFVLYFWVQWIFWVGPFIGAALAAMYHQIVIRAIPFKSRAWFNRWILVLSIFSLCVLFLFFSMCIWWYLVVWRSTKLCYAYVIICVYIIILSIHEMYPEFVKVLFF